MWRHRCAGGLKKKLYLRWGSQRHRRFVGFFNVYVLHRHGTTLFIRWIRHNAFYDTLGIRRTYSRLKPRRPHGGFSSEKDQIWHSSWFTCSCIHFNASVPNELLNIFKQCSHQGYIFWHHSCIWFNALTPGFEYNMTGWKHVLNQKY